MSKDIRSFFKTQHRNSTQTVTKPTTSKKTIQILSDDDEIPESPEISKVKNKKQKRNRLLVDSSDEEDIFVDKKVSKNEKEPIKKLHKKEEKKLEKPLKEVSAVDIFGSGPIKRTEIPRIEKRKPMPKTETEIHSDDEFDKTLLELDEKSIDVEISNQKGNDVKNHKDQHIETIEIKESPIKSNKVERYIKEKPDKTKSRDNREERSDKKKEKKKDNTDKKDKHETKSSTKDAKISSEKVRKDHKSPHKEENDSNLHSTRNNGFQNKAESKYNTKSEKKDKSELKSHDKDKIEVKSPGKDITQKSPEKDKDEVKSTQKDKKEFKSPSKNKNFNVERNEKKREFSEFIDGEDCQSEEAATNNKRKREQSFNESVLSDEERHERKRHNKMLYQSYLNRSGPKNLGSKELPQGKPNCLKDLSFLLTGVLDSFERDEIAEAIKNYGGCVKSGISKKVNYIIAGDDAGPAKVAKAEEFHIPILNEDKFIDLIKTKSGLKNDEKNDKSKILNKEHGDSSSKSERSKENKEKDKPTVEKDVKNLISRSFYGKTKAKEKDNKDSLTNEKKDEIINDITIDKERINSVEDDVKAGSSNEGVKEVIKPDVQINKGSWMWVEKYKPQSIKQIVGQHGDASNVKKLIKWLTAWYVNRKQKLSKPSPWSKNDDGGYYKAALLSGPPGIGKTTTVSLVCKELGFDVVEFNASDTRSKTMLKDEIQQMLGTNSLAGFVTGSKSVTKKKVLVMDEVDGMAGNEDRGGLQELITLIKTSLVPIICMCNDRNNPKMRSLSNYCYDLRFSRPRVDQIKSFLMSVCCREKVKVPPDVLVQIITTANQDIRQSLTLLSLYAGAQLTSKAMKDVKMGPWEAIRRVFSLNEHKTMSIHDKSDLFFSDYSLMPLFVQENYLIVTPQSGKNEILKRIAYAADSISFGDLIESKIRSSGAWGLLPTQAMFSSVIPGDAMAGNIGGQIQFPSWLGKNSRKGKLQRLATMLHAHTRLTASGSKESILLDYSNHILKAVTSPLSHDGTDGIISALEVMKSYHLLRDDLDSMAEISVWPGRKDPMQGIEAKVKAAFTRTFNKESGALPYAPASFKKMAHSSNTGDDELLAEGDELDDGNDQDSDGDDIMIKKKPKVAAKVKSNTEEKPEKVKKGKGKKS